MNDLLVVDLGTLPYAAALELQRDVARRRISGEIAEEVERGGDITFHGPGQLVGYPIIDLKRHRKDLHWYLRQVEEALIQAIAPFGLVGGRVEKYTGVWVNVGDQAGSALTALAETGNQHLGLNSPPRKLASIGVHARDWVTWHGFALNVNTDLRYFDLIVPCGISDVSMTSVSRELDAGSIAMQVATDEVTRAFGSVFDLTPQTVSVSSLAATGVVGAEAGAVSPPLR